jgi:hypothetical protein
MTAVYFEPDGGDRWLRERLYGGDLVVFAPSPATQALVAFARSMLEDAFAPLEPTVAQYELTVERFVEIFAALKPAFIHHPRTVQLVADVVAERHLDLDRWYLDVPRLRGVTSDGYLTAGVGYQHHPHRDTWYSAPLQQLNWWMPIYPYASTSSMAFHPEWFGQALANDSAGFDYYEWNAVGRRHAASMIRADTRRQPRAIEPLTFGPETRIVTPPGGVQLFSAAHLHSTVANDSGRTRFSIDFRTVHLDDLRERRGAPWTDEACSGTSLRDFRRGRDLEAMPDDVVVAFDGASGGNGNRVLVFRPESHRGAARG